MKRWLVRFPSQEVKADVLQRSAMGSNGAEGAKILYSQPDVMLTPATHESRVRLEKLGAAVFDDVQFAVLPGFDGDDDDGWQDADADWQNAWSAPHAADAFSLQDVVEQIRAPQAWRTTRGRAATIAIVDTGIAGSLSEIAPARRSVVDLPTSHQGQHWIDPKGHGSMCAAIAAGSRADGGRYDGVAPEAAVLAARSDLTSSDLLDIYDELIRALDIGQIAGPLVISNSYGLYTCVAPGLLPENHPYVRGVLDSVDRGAFVCFAAGNNHHDVLCKHDPTACAPNTIWGPNSHDRVISVGTVNRALTNCDPSTPHVNSSRGPGEWAVNTVKPDCVAPTYGEVVWGTSYRRMGWWGTSGACPQVAGVAALILTVCQWLRPDQVGGVIAETCSLLPEGKTCVGGGVIDCAAAVGRAAQITPNA
jgi:subtilisin family serine protease